MADRSSPFDGIEELLDRLNRQFETAARSWDRDVESRGRFDLSMGDAATSVDLADEGDEFVAVVDVPGYEHDDIDLHLAGDQLAIEGERDQEVEESEDRFIRRERTSQSFSRRLQLPEPVDADGASATLNNGVLTITLPKLEPGDDSQSIDIE
ncbi:Hsp20/alpha crystallin family protein [Halosolutus gelatinilyticus]|uniref:Hsp20/alpha crystallin family protein n=1 Tax=Halosolutus gelatinilyticus TaxID=2931975 RepID=UPI001FF5BFF3|nr:Hsp20/alpha crystallin family protein [Halosolutus gelatinilyticus]